MDAARWNRMEALFEQALALPPEQRPAFLEAVCRDDAALRAELERLLDAHQNAPGYFDDLAEALFAPEKQQPGFPVPDPHRLLGQTISHYKVLAWLGGGGMGVVYKAEDTRLQRTVALKFLSPDLSRDEEAKRRFIHEARAASALDHPNICTIHEVDETAQGQLFIAMSCYEGETLKEKIARGPLPAEEALRYAVQIAEGLARAHERGIVHRDVKPANVIVTQDGVVKIVDFGLAKLTGRTQLTRPQTAVGTVAYMSPEQAGGGPVDHRTDLWSLGVVLYEMLTGERPFRGDFEQAVLYAIRYEDPAPIEQPREDLPPALLEVVHRCLEKEPGKRFPSAAALSAKLKEIARDRSAELPVPQQATSSTSRRLPAYVRPAAFGAAGVAAMLLLLLWILPGRTAVPAWLGFTSLPEARHLAVLPFRNIGDDPNNQIFCDGLMETLTSKLTQLEQFSDAPFWVVPASDVISRNITSADEARRTFGANMVVTGSMLRERDQIRLTLNLIDAQTLRQLDTEIIDFPVASAPALQDEAVIRTAAMLHVGLQPEAGRVLTAGSTTIPGAYEFYLQGRGYLQRYEKVENIDTAIDLFGKALREDPDYALALAGLGEAYWRKYEATKDVQWVEQAVHHCERAAELNGLLAPVRVTLGLIHTGTGRYSEALQAFQQALELDPFNADAYRGRAKAFEAQGRIAEAEATFKKAIEMKPDYWAGYNDLGIFYYRHGRYEDAVTQFRQVTVLTPDNYRVYSDLGGLYFYMERWEEAHQMLERSLMLKPTYQAYSNLATLYYYKNQFKDAAQMFEEALKLEDHDHRIWGFLGSSYYWMPEKRTKARETFRRAITLAEEQHRVNSNDAELLAYMAGYYALIGEHTRAHSLVQRAINLGSTDLGVSFLISYTYEQLGERELALESLGMALEKGYSIAQIEREPGLRKLRADPRFQQMIGKYSNQ